MPTPRPKATPASQTHGRVASRVKLGASQQTYSETFNEDALDPEAFPPGVEPARVRYAAGMTIKLQDYESLRIDCEVVLPCRPSDINETMDRAIEFVVDRLNTEQETWLGSIPKKR